MIALSRRRLAEQVAPIPRILDDNAEERLGTYCKSWTSASGAKRIITTAEAVPNPKPKCCRTIPRHMAPLAL
jgi:hypothetical protein